MRMISFRMSMRAAAMTLCALAAMTGCGSTNNTTNTDASTGVSVARGQTVVTNLGCASCHQSATAADGVLSGQTTPRPGTMAYGLNITPDMETGIGSWSDAQIITALRTGVDDEGHSLCATMPRYPQLSNDDAASIVAYLRSIPAVHREVPESQCGGGDASTNTDASATTDTGATADAASRD